MSIIKHGRFSSSEAATSYSVISGFMTGKLEYYTRTIKILIGVFGPVFCTVLALSFSLAGTEAI
jgi:hypothetical protein